MRIRDVMTPEVKLASPSDTVQQAAEMMAEIDAGSLPVGEDDRIVPARNARILASRIPDATLELVPGGHLFLMEHPVRCAGLVADFVQTDRADHRPGLPDGQSS